MKRRTSRSSDALPEQLRHQELRITVTALAERFRYDASNQTASSEFARLPQS